MKILFWGDSVTDANRIYDRPASLGVGYAHLVRCEIGFERPERHEFINRGVNGRRVTDLYEHVVSDVIDLRPDVLSILVGVNDAGNAFRPEPSGVDADKYYATYDVLLTEIREALPDVRILILEPFVLNGSATAECYGELRREVLLRAEAARRVAEQHGALFVPLQAGFDKLIEHTPASVYLEDGVHPTAYGHTYIKNEWLRAFRVL